MTSIRKITVAPPEPLIFKGDNTITLLGFDVLLSAGEYSLLRFIAQRSPKYTTANDVGAANITPSSFPVIISSINKKAARISSRRLIISQRCRGYRLNPCI